MGIFTDRKIEWDYTLFLGKLQSAGFFIGLLK